MDNKPRWEYRFDNFKRAYFLLQEATEEYSTGSMQQLSKEGTIQRFEVCVELAWKTLKDYMEFKNFVFAQITPNAIIKEAFSAKIIDEGEAWMSALDDRNKMSHTYDFREFEKVLQQIQKKYLECFSSLYETLSMELTPL